MTRLVIFASGNGSNAERVITYFRENKLAEVVLILTNNPKAGVIDRAKRLSVPCEIFDRKAFYESDQVLTRVQDAQPDLIILAGFLWKCPSSLIAHFPDQIINIHPSLLPKYGGKGMYGLHVHEAVIANREKESGITIHYINEHYDQGAVIRQEKTIVSPTDTPDSLAQKVHALEYQYFPIVIEQLLQKV